MVRALVIILYALIALPPVVASAQTETGVYVCSEYNTTTNQCTTFSPIAENSMSLDTVGFTAETVGYSIAIGMSLLLGLFLLGVAVGGIWKFIGAALGGPL